MQGVLVMSRTGGAGLSTAGRVPGLDGLRAIAALLVLVYHTVPGRARAGFIGVDVFFVLSGFLITAMLLRNRARFGSLRFGDFLGRRMRRLYPAVVVATLGSAALAALAGGDALVALPRQILGSLTASYNWIEISNGASYFEHASPLLLTNMWSLALEQQFYFVWPLVFAGLLLIGRRWVLGGAIALGTASVAWHTYLVSTSTDPTRAYMGTDSHLWGLMMGAAIALAVPNALGALDPSSQPRARILGAGAWLGLGGIVGLGFFGTDNAFMYPWGMLVSALCAALLVRAMLSDVQTSSPEARGLAGVLSVPPLVWLGERSYGIYLWHWPLAVLMFYQFPYAPIWVSATVIAAGSILCAHLSYTWIETPIRTIGTRRWLRARWADIQTPSARTLGWGIAAAVIFAVAVTGVIRAPATSTAQDAVEQGRHHVVEVPRPDPTPAPTGIELPEPRATDDAIPEPSVTPSPPPSAPGTATPTTVDGSDVTIVGDSVTLAASKEITGHMPSVQIDAEESRSSRVAAQILKDKAMQGDLRDIVVVALATNGNIREIDTEEILEAIGPNRVLIYVTGFGPSRAPWIAEANAEIERAAAAYPDQIIIADWHDAIEGHSDYLAGDAVHPGADGAKVYSEVVTEACERAHNR